MRKMRQQRGTVILLVTSGVVALLGAVGLSIDAGYIFTFKNQLQNAVDAAALAGAQGLLADPSNYSTSGRAVQLATSYAALNRAGGQPVTLSPSEITFPKGNMIRIQVTRPASTFFMKVLGISQVGIQATAAAAVVPATGGTGLRPFTLLDQFGHGSLCVSPNDEVINKPAHGDFNSSPHTWMGITVASDHYKSPYDPSVNGWDLSNVDDCSDVTGLIAPRDVDGQQIQLKAGSWLTPGNFGPAALGGRGASNYENNIIYGSNTYVQIGDILDTETGNMVGPTRRGVDGLIAQDPSAHIIRTSTGRWAVVSDRYPMNESPRIVAVPMYSIYYPPTSGRTTFRVDSIGSFFIERNSSQYVYGRFVQSRLKGAQPGTAPRNSGSQTVSGGGRLLGTVQLVSPN
jgi:Flp pilus assembly protein TadG